MGLLKLGGVLLLFILVIAAAAYLGAWLGAAAVMIEVAAFLFLALVYGLLLIGRIL